MCLKSLSPSVDRSPVPDVRAICTVVDGAVFLIHGPIMNVVKPVLTGWWTRKGQTFAIFFNGSRNRGARRALGSWTRQARLERPWRRYLKKSEEDCYDRYHDLARLWDWKRGNGRGQASL